MTVIALLLTGFSVYLTLLLRWDGPFRDLWEFVDDIERQFNGQWDWHYLLEPYGGAHRLLLPKLLFFADYDWLGGRNILTVGTALLSQFAYLILLLRALWQQNSFSHAERCIVGASFAIALFSTTQIYNFLYAMDAQWHMSNLLGLMCLSLLSQPADRRHWALILLSGIAAALCNFTGLMALPVAMLVLLLEKPRQLQHYLVLLISGSFCLWYVGHSGNDQQIVFAAIRSSDSLQMSAAIMLSTMLKVVPYSLLYLASPLSRSWPLVGSCLSVAGLVMILWYWRLHWLGKLDGWQKLCLYIASYIAISACFTGFGRFIYANSATTERYQTLVLPWLPALAAMVWPTLQGRIRQLAVLLWPGLLALHLWPVQASSASEMSLLSLRVGIAHTAARAGVLDHPYIGATLSYPLIKNNINSVKDNDAFLRSRQLGYFRHLPAFALGSTPVIPPGLTACAGETSVRHDDTANAWIVEGKLLSGDRPAADIALLQDGRVIGLGLLLRPVSWLLPASWQDPGTSQFRAFASANHLDPARPTILLGIRSGQATCQMPLLLP